MPPLPTPRALVDPSRLEANCVRMQARARALGVSLRPHVKPHKCVEVGKNQGSTRIPVSTLAEARAMIDAGFDDFTWAVPVPTWTSVYTRSAWSTSRRWQTDLSRIPARS